MELNMDITFVEARRCNYYSAKRSDVTGNRFEWELGENKVI